MYVIAQHLSTPTYVTNLVQLIGLGIAIDYSLLIVYRFREELARGLTKDDAIVRTMETAGRAVVFSGATVALGLALLLFMPLPFMRSMGVGGFLIPIVSIIAAVTLQPALLSVYGRRGTTRWPAARVHPRPAARAAPAPPGTVDVDRGFWARLARAIMAQAGRLLRPIGALLLVVLAIPAAVARADARLGRGDPADAAVGAGLRPARERGRRGGDLAGQMLVDAGPGGNVLAGPTQAAILNSKTLLDVDEEVAAVQYAAERPLRRPDGPLRAGDRRRQARVRRPAGAGVRPPAARRDRSPAQASRRE